jgi:hypothetical protein
MLACFWLRIHGRLKVGNECTPAGASVPRCTGCPWDAGFDVTVGCRGSWSPEPASRRSLSVCQRQQEAGISRANNFCFRTPRSLLTAHYPRLPGFRPILNDPLSLLIRLAPTALAPRTIPSCVSAPIRPLCHGSRPPVCSLLLIKPRTGFIFTTALARRSAGRCSQICPRPSSCRVERAFPRSSSIIGPCGHISAAPTASLRPF